MNYFILWFIFVCQERQKDKDSPYNFNNPPLTQLNLEEYEKTGKVVAVTSSSSTCATAPAATTTPSPPATTTTTTSTTTAINPPGFSSNNNNIDAIGTSSPQPQYPLIQETSNDVSMGGGNNGSKVAVSRGGEDEEITNDESLINQSFERGNRMVTNGDESSRQQHQPNRTKFSDVQIRALNDAFRRQRYPKDDQVARMAKQLGLKQVNLFAKTFLSSILVKVLS